MVNDSHLCQKATFFKGYMRKGFKHAIIESDSHNSYRFGAHELHISLHTPIRGRFCGLSNHEAFLLLNQVFVRLSSSFAAGTLLAPAAARWKC